MSIESTDGQWPTRFCRTVVTRRTRRNDQAGFPPLRLAVLPGPDLDAGNNRGQELPKSGRESEVAMDYPVQNVVVVAALR